MTREQILAMDTGREFDYLVGEKVMNYSIYHYDKDHPDGCYYMLVDENFESVTDEVGWSVGERKTEKEAWKDCPNYSTDIAAAFEVVEKLTAAGYCFKLKYDPRIYEQNFTAELKHLLGNVIYEAKAETAPHAICLAALLTKEATP